MKRFYKLFLAFGLILLWVSVKAQTKISFQEFDLDNGLHVILHQDNSSPVVAINIMYHVGSKNEQSNRTGFAHFFEHLMFEGSEYIKRGEYMKYVQNAGGKFNAATSFDYTYYYETLPSNQLKLGLWLESERMLHLRIDSIGVETQRKVVKEERRSHYENQPYGSVQQDIFSHAFKESPYRWIPIGEVQYIDQASITEFRDFHNKFYVPENAVLAIAGDIKYDEVKKLVQDYFDEIPKGGHEIYRPNIIESSQVAEVRDTIYDNIQLPAVVMAYHIPKQGSEDYYALDMLQNLLSGGKSSRLYKSLVDEQQVALQTMAIPYALEKEGLYIFFGLSNRGVDPQKVEEAINNEIEKIKNNGLDSTEFKKLQNQIENSYVSGYSTFSGIAQTLAVDYTLFKDPNLINTEYDKYIAVTKEDIQRVAQKYLKNESRVVLYYLPKTSK